MNNDAKLALQIDRLMRQFHSDLHPRAQQIDAEKIGPIGGMILFVISERGPITAQEISAALGRDKSQVSRVVSLLIRKGMIDKSSDSSDARSSPLYVSDKGALQVAAFHGALVETTKSLLGQLNRDEALQFSGLLAKILDVQGEPQ
ncbi:MAG: MarR family winged helix-turn-helix transcriptional regulator [Pseudomonadota bacterium]